MKYLTLLLIVLLAATTAAAVTVDEEVLFSTSSTNTTYRTGINFTASNITVYPDALNINNGNLSIIPASGSINISMFNLSSNNFSFTANTTIANITLNNGFAGYRLTPGTTYILNNFVLDWDSNISSIFIFFASNFPADSYRIVTQGATTATERTDTYYLTIVPQYNAHEIITISTNNNNNIIFIDYPASTTTDTIGATSATQYSSTINGQVRIYSTYPIFTYHNTQNRNVYHASKLHKLQIADGHIYNSTQIIDRILRLLGVEI